MIYKLPKVFYADLAARQAPIGEIVGMDRSHYHVELTEAERKRLVRDAKRSLDPANGRVEYGLAGSARATITILED